VSNILCRLQVDDEFKPQEICADGDRHVERRRMRLQQGLATDEMGFRDQVAWQQS
jgi:hypothetical protein